MSGAKTVKDKAFQKEFQQYQSTSGQERQESFIKWIKSRNGEYSQAWKTEDDLEKKYEWLQDSALDDVSRARATMKSADSRIDFKLQ